MVVEHTADIDRKTYVASAGQTAFPFPIWVPGPGMLKVWCDATQKLEGVHWSATGYGTVPGITVTFNDPMVGGEIILIKLDLPYNQLTDYNVGGRFTAEQHEAGLDYQHNLIRQTRALVGRGLRFEDTASSVHDDMTMPAVTGNAGKFLRVNGGATGLEWGTGTGGGGGATLPIDAQDVNLTGPYTGAFNIGLDRESKRLLKITPDDFSATQLLRDGSYNAQPHYQAMCDSANLGEGTPHFPRGTWRWDSEVVADYRGKSTAISTRGFDIVGEGPGACVINYSGAIGLRIISTPATTSWSTFANVGGFRMINNPGHTGKAIYLDAAAYLHLHHVSIYNATWAIDGVDVLSSELGPMIYATGVLYGMRLQRVSGSRPNSMLIMGNHIGAWNYGCLLIEPNTVKLMGNSWEGCGKLGADVNRYAVRVQGAGVIGGGVSFDAEHIEGTRGVADIWIVAGTADGVYQVNACTLQKTDPVNYPEYNIRVDQLTGDGDVRLRVENTTFSTHNGYVAGTAGRAIRFFSADGNFWLSESNNHYEHDIEMPNQPCDEVFAHALVNGALSGPITPIQQHNFTAVTKVGTGHYTLPFRSPGRFATKVATATLVGTSPGQIRVTNYSTTSITVRIWSDFAMTTPADATFAVHVID